MFGKPRPARRRSPCAGLGGTLPLASNASAAGREQNRRVEIIVSGNSISDMPYWASRYTLVPHRQ